MRYFRQAVASSVVVREIGSDNIVPTDDWFHGTAIPQPQLQLCDLSEEVDACRPFLENLCTQANVQIDFNLTDEALHVQSAYRPQ